MSGTNAGRDPQSESDEDRAERIRYKRIRMEAEYHAQSAYALAFAIWAAVDDLDEVPENLHPADVVSKYLCRGNIRKDGDW